MARGILAFLVIFCVALVSVRCDVSHVVQTAAHSGYLYDPPKETSSARGSAGYAYNEPQVPFLREAASSKGKGPSYPASMRNPQQLNPLKSVDDTKYSLETKQVPVVQTDVELTEQKDSTGFRIDESDTRTHVGLAQTASGSGLNPDIKLNSVSGAMGGNPNLQTTTTLRKQFYTFEAPDASEFFDTYERDTVQENLNTLSRNIQVIFIKTPTDNRLEQTALSHARAASESDTHIYVLQKRPDISGFSNRLTDTYVNRINHPQLHFIKYKTADDEQRAVKEIQAQYEAQGGESEYNLGGKPDVLNYATTSGSTGPIGGGAAYQLLSQVATNGAPRSALGAFSSLSSNLSPQFSSGSSSSLSHGFASAPSFGLSSGASDQQKLTTDSPIGAASSKVSSFERFPAPPSEGAFSTTSSEGSSSLARAASSTVKEDFKTTYPSRSISVASENESA